MGKCRRVKRLLSAYLDQETSKSDTDFIKTHLDGCLSCRRELDQFYQIKQLVLNKERRSISADRLILDLEEETVGLSLPQEVPVGSLASRFMPVPAVLAILLFVFVFVLRQDPVEYSLEDRILSGEPVTTETAAKVVLGINS